MHLPKESRGESIPYKTQAAVLCRESSGDILYARGELYGSPKEDGPDGAVPEYTRDQLRIWKSFLCGIELR